MWSKAAMSKKHVVVLLTFLIVGIVMLLIVSQSYFNSAEINSLVEQAEQQGLEYEVIIHNQFTNSYSFTAETKTE